MMKTDRSLGNKPAFYLVYLVFYFIPWLIIPPSVSDIVAITIALVLFLPVYFHAARQQGRSTLPHIALMSVLSMALAPFLGGHGVFHIYATVQAGLLRPERFAWIIVFAVSAAYLVFSVVSDQVLWDILFPLFMGFLIAVGVISAAGQEEKQKLLERSSQLDKQMAAQSERERIAQDLHDVLGQTLTMVTVKTELARKLVDRDPNQAKKELDEVLHASRSALEDIRQTVFGMTSATVTKELVRAETILKSAGVTLKVDGNAPVLETTLDHVLGLAIREAVTNIVRHAQATQATFSWQVQEQIIKLDISDNGASNKCSEGSGLKGMRKRLEKAGGQLLISCDAGIRLAIEVPNA